MNGSNATRFQVEATCSQCGAPTILRDGEHILSCVYCKTRQLLVSSDYPVYFINPVVSSDFLFFAPYWLIRGKYFLVTQSKTIDRIVDINFLAVKKDYLPYSLGLRHQVLKLTILQSNSDFCNLLPPEIQHSSISDRISGLMRTESKENIRNPIRTPNHSLSDTEDVEFLGLKELSKLIDCIGLKSKLKNSRERIDRILNRQDNGGMAIQTSDQIPFFDEFIEENVSLVYFPYTLQNKVIIDGITGLQVGSAKLRETELHFENTSDRNIWTARPLLCPDCGWDLDARPDSTVFLCRNCSKAWGIQEGIYCEYPICVQESEGRDSIYIPFWKMSVTVKGIKKWKVNTAVIEPCEIAFDPLTSISLFLWAPAFRTAPHVFLKSAVRISIFNPRDESDISLKNHRMYPVTLSSSFAFKNARMILFEMAKYKSYPLSYPQHFKKLCFQLYSSRIVFIPFTKTGSELLHPTIPFAIPHQAFRGITTVEEI